MLKISAVQAGRLYLQQISDTFMSSRPGLGGRIFITDMTNDTVVDNAEPSMYSSEYDLIRSHPYVQNLIASGDFSIFHGYDIPEEDKEHAFTAGTLIGPGRIAETPLTLISTEEVISTSDTCEMYVFYHVGPKLCGHKGIIHGGLLATLLDESLCRCGFPLLPSRLGVTANLEIKYLAPTVADTFIVVHATTVEKNGRKVWVDGEVLQLPFESDYILDQDLKVSVKAKLLLIEPKYVTKLDRSIAHNQNDSTRVSPEA